MHLGRRTVSLLSSLINLPMTPQIYLVTLWRAPTPRLEPTLDWIIWLHIKRTVRASTRPTITVNYYTLMSRQQQFNSVYRSLYTHSCSIRLHKKLTTSSTTLLLKCSTMHHFIDNQSLDWNMLEWNKQTHILFFSFVVSAQRSMWST